MTSLPTHRLAELADRLRALHHAREPLVLPNIWDAGSARLVQEAGFAAVATTSGGVAASLGWADGQQTPVDEVFGALARIARVLDVPVSADLEAGYDLAPDAFVARMLAAGAVGCNLEDTDHSTAQRSLRDAAEQAEWLRAVKTAARASGVDIVLNARVDVFIRQRAETRAEIDEAIRRAKLYLDAGADCIYPILVHQESTIEALVAAIPGPINVYAMPDTPSLVRLAEIGVRRISFATRLHRAALRDLQRRLESIAAGVSAEL
jgi:2-methylisocitrate lyase-like PEP mutase family enzyme